MTAEPIGDAALAEVVRLAEGATPGPWHDDGCETITGEVPEGDDGNIVCRAPGWPDSDRHWPDNRAFIAAANPATVLAMRARITAAEAECQHGMALIGELTTRAESAEAERDRLRAALVEAQARERAWLAAFDRIPDLADARGDISLTKADRQFHEPSRLTRAALAGADR